jgi:CDP-6-deoxy-D-xylo-4-hexulose-3-dehydrase
MGSTYSCLAATFSLYHSHHISTIEGGVVCTNDARINERLRIQRAHGWLRDIVDDKFYRQPTLDPRFTFVDVGYNMRPTEIAAALGLVQLPKLNHIVDQRNENWRSFRTCLGAYHDVFEFQCAPINTHPAWFGFNVLVKEGAPFTRIDLRRYLECKGIETRPVVAGNIARQPAMSRIGVLIPQALTQADRIHDRALSIGIHQGLDFEAKSYVIDCFRQFVEGGERCGS